MSPETSGESVEEHRCPLWERLGRARGVCARWCRRRRRRVAPDHAPNGKPGRSVCRVEARLCQAMSPETSGESVEEHRCPLWERLGRARGVCARWCRRRRRRVAPDHAPNGKPGRSVCRVEARLCQAMSPETSGESVEEHRCPLWERLGRARGVCARWCRRRRRRVAPDHAPNGKPGRSVCRVEARLCQAMSPETSGESVEEHRCPLWERLGRARGVCARWCRRRRRRVAPDHAPNGKPGRSVCRVEARLCQAMSPETSGESVEAHGCPLWERQGRALVPAPAQASSARTRAQREAGQVSAESIDTIDRL
ncbi:hypothetical protein ABMA28_009281 [Loxostege sticticalis]|uniref:Uncharacterized protein n=1 Tax=Loxostege sticticalis TaxID=481309 RepID=A0ABD0SCR9_LOXSC